jgi:glyoxylase-like metal-dependent hydrolase (beta-lactamase superfamily II)
MQKWRVGEVTITGVVEREGLGDINALIPLATSKDLLAIPWLYPHFRDATGQFRAAAQALVIETPSRRRIVVDTCWGNDKQCLPQPFQAMRLNTPFLEDFARAGFDRKTIDTVLCTHLHFDHVGWNTMLSDGRWVPTFPNARYLFARAEYEHWIGNENEWVVFSESVAPVIEAGLADFVETTQVICDEVSLFPTPGHTPNHVSVKITSGGEEAIITGDFIHSPCQMAHPEWWTIYDSSRERAIATRRQMLAGLAGTRTLVIGTHFPTPPAGRVIADGDAYRFIVEEAS